MHKEVTLNTRYFFACNMELGRTVCLMHVFLVLSIKNVLFTETISFPGGDRSCCLKWRPKLIAVGMTFLAFVRF
jgi:hypothetical protein